MTQHIARLLQLLRYFIEHIGPAWASLLLVIRLISTNYTPNSPFDPKSPLFTFIVIIVIEVKFFISKPLAAPDPWFEHIRIVISIVIGGIEPAR